MREQAIWRIDGGSGREQQRVSEAEVTLLCSRKSKKTAAEAEYAGKRRKGMKYRGHEGREARWAARGNPCGPSEGMRL